MKKIIFIMLAVFLFSIVLSLESVAAIDPGKMYCWRMYSSQLGLVWYECSCNQPANWELQWYYPDAGEGGSPYPLNYVKEVDDAGCVNDPEYGVYWNFYGSKCMATETTTSVAGTNTYYSLNNLKLCGPCNGDVGTSFQIAYGNGQRYEDPSKPLITGYYLTEVEEGEYAVDYCLWGCSMSASMTCDGDMTLPASCCSNSCYDATVQQCCGEINMYGARGVLSQRSPDGRHGTCCPANSPTDSCDLQNICSYNYVSEVSLGECSYPPDRPPKCLECESSSDCGTNMGCCNGQCYDPLFNTCCGRCSTPDGDSKSTIVSGGGSCCNTKGDETPAACKRSEFCVPEGVKKDTDGDGVMDVCEATDKGKCVACSRDYDCPLFYGCCNGQCYLKEGAEVCCGLKDTADCRKLVRRGIGETVCDTCFKEGCTTKCVELEGFDPSRFIPDGYSRSFCPNPGTLPFAGSGSVYGGVLDPSDMLGGQRSEILTKLRGAELKLYPFLGGTSESIRLGPFMGDLVACASFNERGQITTTVFNQDNPEISVFVNVQRGTSTRTYLNWEWDGSWVQTDLKTIQADFGGNIVTFVVPVLEKHLRAVEGTLVTNVQIIEGGFGCRISPEACGFVSFGVATDKCSLGSRSEFIWGAGVGLNIGEALITASWESDGEIRQGTWFVSLRIPW